MAQVHPSFSRLLGHLKKLKTFFVKEEQSSREMAKLREVKQKMISLMDLTTLDKDSDTEEKVRQLVALGTDNALETSVAAVCVYPEFVLAAKQKASESPAKSLHVATVVNFPSGDEDLESVQKGAKMALDSGADEIDLVICYREYLETASKGEATSARSCELIQSLKDLIERTKAKGQSCCLKVILETGELKAPELIRKASQERSTKPDLLETWAECKEFSSHLFSN